MSDRNISLIRNQALTLLKQVDPHIHEKIVDMGIVRLQDGTYWLQFTLMMSTKNQKQIRDAIPRQLLGHPIKKTIEFVAVEKIKHLSPNSISDNEPNQLWILEADAKASVLIKTQNTFQPCDSLLCAHVVDEIKRGSNKPSIGIIPFSTKLKGRLEHFPSRIIVPSFSKLKSDMALAEIHLSKNSQPDPYQIATADPDRVYAGDETVYFYNQYDQKITGKITRIHVECPEDKTKNLLRLDIDANPGDSGSAIFAERNKKPEIIGIILCKYENGKNDLVYAANLMHVKDYLMQHYYSDRTTSLEKNTVYLFSRKSAPKVNPNESTGSKKPIPPIKPLDFYKIFHGIK